jgi:DNA polymerase III subunit beta
MMTPEEYWKARARLAERIVRAWRPVVRHAAGRQPVDQRQGSTRWTIATESTKTANKRKRTSAESYPFDVEVSSKQFVEALGAVLPAVDKKSAKPALACVLLTARDGALVIEATDLNLAIRSTAVAEVAAPGAVVIGATDLLERVKAMPDGPVRVTASAESRVTLRSIGAARRFELAGIAAAEYPKLPAPGPAARTMHVRASLLLDLVARTHYAISSDATRPHVNSALLEDGDKVITMVATDGHRLSVAKAPADISATERLPPMLLQLKAVGAIRRLVDSGDEAVDIPIRCDGAWAFVEAGGCRLATKLIDAQFPPYQAVVPARAKIHAVVGRMQLLDALRAVAVAADVGGVKLAVEHGRLSIRAEDIQGGSGLDELEVDYDGPRLNGAFNARYLTDVLAPLPCESVELEFGDGLEPLTIRQAEQAESFVAVIMPMRA